MKTSDTVLLEKYASHFIWKGCVWVGVGDQTELQHIDPHSIGHNCVSFPVSWAAQPGTWGPSLSGTCSHSSIFSPTPTSWLIGGLRAPSAGCWLSLPHLVSNWSGLQTNWLPVFTELYNSSRPPSSCGRHKLHSFNPSTVKATLCCSSTGCTCYLHRCILTARPGRRSIYNIILFYGISNLYGWFNTELNFE